MSEDLERMLENVRQKLFEKDYAILKTLPADMNFYYALYVRQPLRMRSHLNPQVTEQGIVYYASGNKDELLTDAQEENVTKVLITGIHLE